MWVNRFLAAIKDAIKKPPATYAKTDADAEAAAAWTVTSPSNRDLLTMCATWRRRSAATAELACCGKRGL